MVTFSAHFCKFDMFGYPLKAKTWREAYDETQSIIEITPNAVIKDITIERHWVRRKYNCPTLTRMSLKDAKKKAE